MGESGEEVARARREPDIYRQGYLEIYGKGHAGAPNLIQAFGLDGWRRRG